MLSCSSKLLRPLAIGATLMALPLFASGALAQTSKLFADRDDAPLIQACKDSGGTWNPDTRTCAPKK
jgi:hypothetical protein